MTTQLSEMFCNQCEQAAKGTGCEIVGVCGKSPDVAALQDLLVHASRALAQAAVRALDAGLDLAEESEFVEGALFTTLTNVDFDGETVAAKVDRAIDLRDSLMDRLLDAGVVILSSVSLIDSARAMSLAEKVDLAATLGRPWDTSRDADVQSLQETTLYGMKGVAAYAHHAYVLGQEAPSIYAYLFKALAAPTLPEAPRRRQAAGSVSQSSKPSSNVTGAP